MERGRRRGKGGKGEKKGKGWKEGDDGERENEDREEGERDWKRVDLTFTGSKAQCFNPRSSDINIFLEICIIYSQPLTI